MSTERDTHFLGSAEKLYEKLVQNAASSEKGLSDVEAFKQEQHTIIAQFAYDLTVHLFKQVATPYTPGGVQGYIHMLRDMTVWPDTSAYGDLLADLAKIANRTPKPPSTNG